MVVISRLNCGSIVKQCKQITNLRPIVGMSQKIKLTWENPDDEKFAGVMIRYKEGSFPNSPEDGELFSDNKENSSEKDGFEDGKTYYIRAFAYTYKYTKKIYNLEENGAETTATPFADHGNVTITESQEWTVPYNVEAIDLFLVGGGSAGYTMKDIAENVPHNNDGGGSGYTTTKKVSVTPGDKINIIIGAGGTAAETYKKNDTQGGGSDTIVIIKNIDNIVASGARNSTGGYSLSGGSNGGQNYSVGSSDGSPGQNRTTRAFGEESGTMYADGGSCGGYLFYETGLKNYASPSAGHGGGCGGGYGSEPKLGGAKGGDGEKNTGSGGGGCGSCAKERLPFPNENAIGGNGGSGIVLIRW